MNEKRVLFWNVVQDICRRNIFGTIRNTRYVCCRSHLSYDILVNWFAGIRFQIIKRYKLLYLLRQHLSCAKLSIDESKTNVCFSYNGKSNQIYLQIITFIVLFAASVTSPGLQLSHMSIMMSQITVRSSVQLFDQAYIKENIKAPRHWPFVEGIHRSPVDSPHKVPVKRKIFLCHDVIMQGRYFAIKKHLLWNRLIERDKRTVGDCTCVVSHERPVVSFHRRLDCLFTLTSTKTSKFRINGQLRGTKDQ